MTKKLMLQELALLWRHIDYSMIAYLEGLSNQQLERIYKLYYTKEDLLDELSFDVCSNDEITLDNYKTIDFKLDLEKENTVLFLSASSCYIEKDGKIYRKTILIDPEYALIIKDYDESKFYLYDEHIIRVFQKTY